MPVVWCTDPNSVNNKPTAFALHGIQLQGNVTERQVLALRELVNAAAEGRLILPSDGTFMLLDSGISIESSIVKDSSTSASRSSSLPISGTTKCSSSVASTTMLAEMSNKENIDINGENDINDGQRQLKNTYILMPVTTTAQKNSISLTTLTPPTSMACTPTLELDEQPNFQLEPKYSTFTPPPQMSDEEDILYEFLCCAKCMNDPSTSRCSSMVGTEIQQRKTQSQQLLQRLLKSCERYSIRQREKHSSSINTPRSNSNNNNSNSKTNEQHQMYDPKYNIANKYTRRYQRKHCNMSAATIARNRHHNNRHKLPMQSVKIFHNRNHACINGSGGNSVASTRSTRCNSAGGDSVVSFSSVGLKKPTSATTNTSNCSCNINTSRSDNGNNISICCGKMTKAPKKIPLVVNQQSSALHLPLYATVNKTNGKTKMTMDLSASEQPSKVVTVNAIVHEPPLCKVLIQNRTRGVVEHVARQRKIGAVHGGLQETVQIELESFGQSIKNQLNKSTNCDIVMNSLPEIKDLISFEDDDNNGGNSCNNDNSINNNEQIQKSDDNRSKTYTCDTSSQIVDLLSQPNIDLPAVSKDSIEGLSANKSPPPSRSNASSRKTSFDSTCTISSMDSGFIEMQNKLENPLQTSSHPTLFSIFNNMTPTNSSDQQGQGGEKIARLNYKECLTQSRNRRKSYEEFKAMFANSNIETQSPSTSYLADNNILSENKLSMRRKSNLDPKNVYGKDMCNEPGHQQLGITSSHQHQKENQTEIQTTGSTTTTTIPTLNGLESISEQPTLPTMVLDTEQTLVDLSSAIDVTFHDGAVSSNDKPDFPNEFDVNAVPGTNEMDTGGIRSSCCDSYECGGNTVHCKSNVCCLPSAQDVTNSNNCDTSNTTTDILRKNSDFLSTILDRQLMAKEKEKAHMRRKSYEEFKRLVRECEKNTDNNHIAAANDNTTTTPHFKRQNSKNRKSYAQFLLMRRNSNSKDHNHERQKKKVSTSEAINDTHKTKLELQPVAGQAPEINHGSANYRHNFKIYDKLVYGTIYDIIQRKNDIYNLTCQRYDKYMTYGTIYEILHRKSSQSSPLPSSHSYNGLHSEKFFQRKSLSAILEKDIFSPKEKNTKSDLEKSKKSCMIYDIIQKQKIEQESNMLVKLHTSAPGNTDDKLHSNVCESTSVTNDTTKSLPPVLNIDVKNVNKEVVPITAMNVAYKYGTIYDILQGEKLDSSHESGTTTQQKLMHQHQTKNLVNNRFVVSKIDEPLTENESKIKNQKTPSLERDTEEKGDYIKSSLKVSKPNKMRRLSNMLSYMGGDTKSCDKSNTNSDNKNAEQYHSKDIILQSTLLPLDSEELYARIIAKKRENVVGESTGNIGHIQKSNSLDTISTAVIISPPASPSPPRPRRSLKQHKCLLPDQQKEKQLPLVKKLSLDNSLSAEDRSTTATDKDFKLRRWSNQSPLKCNCDFITLSSNSNSNTSSFSPTQNQCNSWEVSIKMTGNCNCLETLTSAISSNSNNNISTNNNNSTNTISCNSSGVIEAYKTEMPSNNTLIPSSSTFTPAGSSCAQPMRNTCTVHSETVCHCLAKQNITNTPTTTVITTSTASSNGNSKISAKKGKSRRLSEFTRGEFLNEKP